eukprot:UN20068
MFLNEQEQKLISEGMDEMSIRRSPYKKWFQKCSTIIRP